MDWIALMLGVASSVIAAILVALFARSRGWLSFSWRSYSRRHSLYKRMERAGVTNFYASRDDFVKHRGAPRLLDYLSLARKSIGIAAYWMAHGVEMEGIAQGLAEMTRSPRNLQISVAIINPTAPYIGALASYLNMESRELIVRAQSSLDKLWEAREHLSPEERARFRLRVYDTPPIASVIILDAEESDGRVQIDIKAYKTPRHDSFAFELQREGHYLYELCRDAWLRLIEEAQDFEPAKHRVQF
jgi:hypothetical protein